ncbi:MAG: hypothetical protein ACUVUU_04785 [bacterium]
MKVESFIAMLSCLMLLIDAVSLDAYGWDEESRLMQQSDHYLRRLEREQSQRDYDASQAGLLERSDSRVDYLLIAILIIPLVLVVLFSGRASGLARVKKLRSGR